MGAQASRVKPPRVVLDTNVLVSALVFGGRRWLGLRNAWQSGRLVPLVGRATADELLQRLSSGWSLKITKLSEQFGWEEYRQQFALTGFLPLFLLRGDHLFPFLAGLPENALTPQAGDQIMSLVAAQERKEEQDQQ